MYWPIDWSWWPRGSILGSDAISIILATSYIAPATSPSNDAVEGVLDLLIVHRDDMAQWKQNSLGHGGSLLLFWLV